MPKNQRLWINFSRNLFRAIKHNGFVYLSVACKKRRLLFISRKFSKKSQTFRFSSQTSPLKIHCVVECILVSRGFLWFSIYSADFEFAYQFDFSRYFRWLVNSVEACNSASRQTIRFKFRWRFAKIFDKANQLKNPPFSFFFSRKLWIKS